MVIFLILGEPENTRAMTSISLLYLTLRDTVTLGHESPENFAEARLEKLRCGCFRRFIAKLLKSRKNNI